MHLLEKLQAEQSLRLSRASINVSKNRRAAVCRGGCCVVVVWTCVMFRAVGSCGDEAPLVESGSLLAQNSTETGGASAAAPERLIGRRSRGGAQCGPASSGQSQARSQSAGSVSSSSASLTGRRRRRRRNRRHVLAWTVRTSFAECSAAFGSSALVVAQFFGGGVTSLLGGGSGSRRPWKHATRSASNRALPSFEPRQARARAATARAAALLARRRPRPRLRFGAAVITAATTTTRTTRTRTTRTRLLLPPSQTRPAPRLWWRVAARRGIGGTCPGRKPPAEAPRAGLGLPCGCSSRRGEEGEHRRFREKAPRSREGEHRRHRLCAEGCPSGRASSFFDETAAASSSSSSSVGVPLLRRRREGGSWDRLVIQVQLLVFPEPAKGSPSSQARRRWRRRY